jgi:cyanophycinase-like exopeptidase
VAFLARSVEDGLDAAPVGLGLDERTALQVGPDGIGEVFGAGAVHVVVPSDPPQRCAPGEPLEFSGLVRAAVRAGGTLDPSSGITDAATAPLGVRNGVLHPEDPY